MPTSDEIGSSWIWFFFRSGQHFSTPWINHYLDCCIGTKSNLTFFLFLFNFLSATWYQQNVLHELSQPADKTSLSNFFFGAWIMISNKSRKLTSQSWRQKNWFFMTVVTKSCRPGNSSNFFLSHLNENYTRAVA